MVRAQRRFRVPISSLRDGLVFIIVYYCNFFIVLLFFLYFVLMYFVFCMFVFLYICISVFLYFCFSVFVYLCIYVFMYLCICVFVHLSSCEFVYLFICVFVKKKTNPFQPKRNPFEAWMGWGGNCDIRTGWENVTTWRTKDSKVFFIMGFRCQHFTFLPNPTSSFIWLWLYLTCVAFIPAGIPLRSNVGSLKPAPACNCIVTRGGVYDKISP